MILFYPTKKNGEYHREQALDMSARKEVTMHTFTFDCEEPVTILASYQNFRDSPAIALPGLQILDAEHLIPCASIEMERTVSDIQLASDPAMLLDYDKLLTGQPLQEGKRPHKLIAVQIHQGRILLHYDHLELICLDPPEADFPEFPDDEPSIITFDLIVPAHPRGCLSNQIVSEKKYAIMMVDRAGSNQCMIGTYDDAGQRITTNVAISWNKSDPTMNIVMLYRQEEIDATTMEQLFPTNLSEKDYDRFIDSRKRLYYHYEI